MASQTKPIPALYTVYILRSTVRHASLYIGSTPNPPRRLSQHNGVVRGGAVRTSKGSLRPWEMVGLVSGFPSMVAALKFEWALTNPHLSMHIPSTSRLTVSTQVKANGHPRRPPKSLTSVLSNLHLLLRVPSFACWPLKAHFFAPEVYAAWQKWSTTANEQLRASLPVVTCFGPPPKDTTSTSRATAKEDDIASREEGSEEVESPTPWGIHALPLDYEPMKDYVAKGQGIFEFEQEGDCVVCREAIVSGQGLHALCANGACDGVGHLACWSRQLLPRTGENADDILPVQGKCPKCHGDVQWGDMMTELTLRLRGQKEVEKLLKTKRKRRVAKANIKTVVAT
ncbi:structure-specific endonuclease subunit SLX1 [Bombardia bombarda]|uniref:Structure-specific endonuclease subunit SLX1 n=1 Tax=Bombardia bombarda TaxID=252184 RepID=A0AA39X9U0_9PEZI|nr:structure-specific endonuclease subunit SLX1 [Bombardia bombarda]